MGTDRSGDDRATDALMQTSRLMTAVVARTLANIPDTVTVPQLRVLVMLHTRGALNMGNVAAGLGVNPSNATRTCDKLVDAGLVARSTDPVDRRRGVLELTDHGRELVSSTMAARRAMLAELLDRVPARARRQLAAGLEALLDAVQAGPEAELFTEPRDSALRWLR